MRTKVKQKPRMVTLPLIGLIISGEDEDDDDDDDGLITRVLSECVCTSSLSDNTFLSKYLP